MVTGGKIINCYSNNTVSGTRAIGGLLGYMQNDNTGNEVINSYSTGYLVGTGKAIGGLASTTNAGAYINSYYDVEVSGEDDGVAGLGLKTASFLLSESFDASWEINGSLDFAQPWVQSEGLGRPYLFTQKVAISNGLPDIDELISYVNTAETISSRGVRYAQVSNPNDWKEIESASKTTGRDVLDLSVVNNDVLYYVQSYVKVGKETHYGEQVRYTHYVNTTPPKPVVRNVIITGMFTVDNTLTLKYIYDDPNGIKQSNSTYVWYVSDDIDGTNKTVINGVTGLTYLLTESDVSKYISVEVTPNNHYLYGDPVESSLYFIGLFQLIENFELPENATVNDEIQLNATSTSGLDVVYTSSDTGLAKIEDGKVIALNDGVVSITASQPGNSVYAEAEPITYTLTISPLSGIKDNILDRS